MFYKPEHFDLEEFVPPEIFAERGEAAWELMDVRILKAADAIREHFGRPVTINNWKWGDERDQSGLRIPGQKYYKKTSQHAHGRAIDCLIAGISAEEARQEILRCKDDKWTKFIYSMENGVNWLHVDCRNCDRIMTYYP